MSLAFTDHRPWPLPAGTWAWRQTWTDLAFIHWEIESSQLRPWIPEPLAIDTFDGTAWIGLVPFDMKGVTRRPLPAFPLFSAFPEINVRTYVTCQGKPGVWFFSLDTPNSLAVWAARRWFHLPYFRAGINVRLECGKVFYTAVRGQRRFRAIYGPEAGGRLEAPAFARWAAERYCLYSRDGRGRIHCCEIHHRPWPLERAVCDVRENGWLSDFRVGARHPEVLFSKRIDVVIWPLSRVAIAQPNVC